MRRVTDADAEKLVRLIRDACFADGTVSGSLCIWGDWFGKPYDNGHRVVRAQAEGHEVTITFNDGETLQVWHPRGIELGPGGLRILSAQRVRWEWFLYGGPHFTQYRYFLDYTFDAGRVIGSSDLDWYVPEFKTDPTLPAVQLLRNV